MAKEQAGNEIQDERATQWCRVRHARTGLYLAVTQRQRFTAHGGRTLAGLQLTWGAEALSMGMSRATARQVAAAYIALTGDHDVEIEPTTNQE